MTAFLETLYSSVGIGIDVVGLILFAICIAVFIWDKLPMSVTAIGSCAIMVFAGICNFQTAFGQFASKTVVLLIGIMIVGTAISETGLAKRMGNVITRFSGDKEWKLLIFAYLMCAFLSLFLTNATVLAIFMPIIVGMSKTNKNIRPMNYIIPLTLASNMGGITTLIGSSQQMTAQGILEELDVSLFGGKPMTFGIFDFTPMGLILIVVGLLYCLFIGLPLGKKIWGNRNDSDCEIEVSHIVQTDKKKQTIMIALLLIMFVSFVFSSVTGVDPTIITTIIAISCIATNCVSYKKAYSSINWNIVLRLGGCLGLAKAIDSAGSVELIAGWVESIGVANLSPFALFAFSVILVQVLSLVISNSTAILVILPLIISMAHTMGLNPQAYAMGIVLGSSMGACCPLSGSTWGMSMSAGYKFRDYFKYGIGIDLIALAVILIFTPIFFPLTLS